jgi:transcriptional regulator with XRE-family HTH domain
MPAAKGNQYAKGNRGGGRPSEYRDEFCSQAAKACEAGFTDKELAELFGVSERTINDWKLAHEEFSAALKTGKSQADERVERGLYHRAVGYTFESEKIFQFQGEIVRAQTREHIPPDTTACIFWLKNRRREAWRDKQEVEHAASGSLAGLLEEIARGNFGLPPGASRKA